MFRKAVRKCVKQSDKLFCLNDALNKEYKDCFNRDLITLFNPADIPSTKPVAPNNIKNLIILYGGSISESRIDVLLAIGNAVKNLRGKGYDVVFNIYGPVQTDAVLQDITRCDGLIQKNLRRKFQSQTV